MPNTQNELDLELIKAIQFDFLDNKKTGTQKALDLLKRGANPFAPLKNSRGYELTAFSEAICNNAFLFLKEIFKKHISSNIIDLSEKCKNSILTTPRRMNLLQAIFFMGSNEAKEMALKYAIDTKQDPKALMDERIDLSEADLFPSLPVLLAGSITVSTCLNENHLVVDKNQDLNEIDQIVDFLNVWGYHNPKKDPQKVIPQYGKPIHISMDCNVASIKLLVDQGFIDFNSIAYEYAFNEFIDRLADISDLKNWIEEFMLYIHVASSAANTDITGGYDPKEPGVALINMTLTNHFEELPQKFVIHFDARKLKAVKDAYLAKQAEVQPHRKSIDALKAKVAQHDEQISDLAEQRRKNIRDALSANEADKAHVLPVFNRIHHMVSAAFLAHEVATTKLFNTKATHKYAAQAQITQSLFTVAADSVPLPFIKLLPAVTGGLLNMALDSNTRATHKAVAEATLGMDTDRLAIDIAILVTCKVMMVHGSRENNDLARKLGTEIVERIKNLKNKQFTSQKELVDFLCETALQTLDKPRAGSGNKTPSTESNTSDTPPVKMFVNAKDSKKKPGKGNKCVIS